MEKRNYAGLKSILSVVPICYGAGFNEMYPIYTSIVGNI